MAAGAAAMAPRSGPFPEAGWGGVGVESRSPGCDGRAVSSKGRMATPN